MSRPTKIVGIIRLRRNLQLAVLCEQQVTA